MAKLGKKWTCFACGTKFYDLSKPEAICPKPECRANQKDAPAKAKAPKRVKAVVHIEDDFAAGENEQEIQDDGLEESFGIAHAKVEGVDPDISMDDYDE